MRSTLALLLGLTALPAPSQPAPSQETPAARFFDVTEAAGIAWTHNNGAFGQRWLPETLGPGVIVLDANGDQRPDLLFINGRSFPGKPGKETTPALYLNLGGLKFKEATQEAGLAFSSYCLGGSAADVDNDGDPDVYLSCVGQDHLLRNDGGRFTDVSQQAGLTRDYELGASAAFFDADRDGWVDLYVARYVRWTPETDQFCAFYGKAKSYCTPIVYQGAASRFYRNRGNGTFEDRTRAAGLYLPEAKALGVVPVDVDGDLWTDLAVTCDTCPNLLFRNKGDGTFEDIGLTSGLALSVTGQARGGMGIDAGDYDHSGRPGLVATYFSREMTGLYHNEGDRFFLDEGPNSEVGRNTLTTLGWGAFFFDFDLDGWLDLLIANGHLDEQVETVQQLVKYAEPQQLFRNQGKGRFQEVTGTIGGDLARPLVARGAAFADLDGDGDPDLVLTTSAGPAKVFENRGPHGNWLRVALQGGKSNRDGLGAAISVTAGGMTQTWQVRAGGSYLSQSEIAPTFGLGAAGTVDTVTVRWPSGTVQTLNGVTINQVLKVVEP
ncbi:MAG: CRTAC1 family protein [Acidobacteriota bacterium]